jgi:acyl carrier protein
MAVFDTQDTKHKIIGIVAAELKIDKSKVTDNAQLADLGADSLSLLEIIFQLEEQFGIEIPDDQAEQFKTLQNVVDYVHARRTK